jgi:hypothetical protein
MMLKLRNLRKKNEWPEVFVSDGPERTGMIANDVSKDEGETYEAVTCLACDHMHFINRSTGRVLGAGDRF